MSYVRYADDWIIGITGPKSLAEVLKSRAKTFLKEKLKLELSMEKTKVTNLRGGYCQFLGFSISVPSPKESKVSDYRKGEMGLMRRVSHGSSIRINIPIVEVVSRLHERGFCDGNGFPTHHKALLALELDQIVNQYNMVMRGIANYYAACKNFSNLNRVSYILRYSLAKTLANKGRTSLAAQFRKRGKSLTVLKTVDDEKMSVSFVDFRPLRRTMFTGKPTELNRILIFNKFRTKSRLGIQNCAVKSCQSGKPVEMHHVKHIRKTGKTVSGFTKLMAMINRKQVPLCTDCHQAVHKGIYDGFALKDLEQSIIYN